MAHTLANPSAGLSGNSYQGNSGFTGWLLAVANAVARKWHESVERASARRALQSMTDYELHDMGISRSDIQRVVDGSFERGR